MSRPSAAPGAWRSAHGPAAGADRARRARDGRRAGRASARIPVEELFAGYYETVLAKDELIAVVTVPAQGDRRAAYLESARRARCMTGRRSVSRSRSTPTARCVDDARDRRQRGDREADAARRRRRACCAAAPSDDAACAAPARRRPTRRELITDAQGSAAYKKQLLRVYRRRAPRALALQRSAR